MVDWDALGTLLFLLVFLAALVGAFILVKGKMKRGMGRVLVLLWLLALRAACIGGALPGSRHPWSPIGW